MLNLVRRVMADEAGASAAEYAILVALVAVAIVAAVPLFGGGLNTAFTKMGTYIGGLVP